VQRLTDKVAIITGGTSGMGEATARRFIEEGATVVLTGRSEERGAEIAEELGERGFYLRTDISNPEDIEHMISWTAERFGRVDCLFNNAGAAVNIFSIQEVTAEVIRDEFDLLVTGVLLGMKHVTPIMLKQGVGSIVNNASVAGISSGYGPIVYSAAKAAVINATKWVAMELAGDGIRVNSISPGCVYTPIFAKVFGPEGMDPEVAEQKAGDAFGQFVPVGRAGDGAEVGALLTYLASDESAFVTGQDIAIDGGLMTGLSKSDMQRNFGTLAGALQE
jgi:NAD(P)-dependent dehydrogenase (short-subunit alcohol dehydrogenase family)